jgi:hypothetical protein
MDRESACSPPPRWGRGAGGEGELRDCLGSHFPVSPVHGGTPPQAGEGEGESEGLGPKNLPL